MKQMRLINVLVNKHERTYDRIDSNNVSHFHRHSIMMPISLYPLNFRHLQNKKLSAAFPTAEEDLWYKRRRQSYSYQIECHITTISLFEKDLKNVFYRNRLEFNFQLAWILFSVTKRIYFKILFSFSYSSKISHKFCYCRSSNFISTSHCTMST